jgi:hypothetical protein
MIAGEVVPPSGGQLAQFGGGLALERALDFLDAVDGGTEAMDFAFVLAAEDLREKPLDHVVRLGVGNERDGWLEW